MPSNSNYKRGARPDSDDVVRNAPADMAFGVAFCLVSILVFLALISFDTGDLPAWVRFNTQPEANSPAKNFIGPLGALAGLGLYLFLGAASFLLPAGLLWVGLSKMTGLWRYQSRVFLGFGLLLISSAAILHVQGWFLHGEQTIFHQLSGSPGGFLGLAIGGMLMQNLLGTAGTLLVLLFVYVAALPLFVGYNPITFARHSLRAFAEQRRLLAERRDRRAREALEVEETAPTKTRANRRRRSTPPADEDEGVVKAGPDGELPLEFMPERKIIDGTARRKSAAGRKSILFPKETARPLESAEFPGYELPGLDLLEWVDPEEASPADRTALIKTQETIVETLREFDIKVTPGDITRGPTVSRYEIYPDRGLRVSRIASLEADLARATRAERINIIAPIPGKDTVGIEIANNDKVLVPLRELLEDPAFNTSKKKIPVALGKDVYGNVVVGDLAAMPHLLVAGATGSGKSVCINSIIASMLFRFTPDELRLIMVDPKVVELAEYNTLPHLVAPVVTDPRKVLQVLRWVVNEMERRYHMFARVQVRNFESFNKRPPKPKEEPKEAAPEPESAEVDEEGIESLAAALENGDIAPGPDEEEEAELGLEFDEIPDRIPFIVVIIDELADLMQTASADVENLIARIAQKARAAGIHLIIATQTPRSTVITGVIKANIPSRIAFQVSSQIDSRVILDTGGAEKLVGKGDMLFLPPGSAQLQRCQGAFITDEEVHHLVRHCSSQGEQKFESRIEQALEKPEGEDDDELTDKDEEMLRRCVEVIIQEKRASTSLLQRRLSLGYTRAARMIDLLEGRGYIGPGDGAKPREVFVRE